MSLPGAVARSLSVVLGLMAGAIALNLPALVNGTELAAHWYESAGAFPLLAAGLILLGALVHLLRLRQRGDAALGDEEVETGEGRLGVALAGLAFFVLLVPAVLLLGFAPGVALFLLAACRGAGLPWRASALFAVIAATVLQLVFVELFHVWFPEPWVEPWITGWLA